MTITDDGIEGVDWWWGGEGPDHDPDEANGDPTNDELADIPPDLFGPYAPDADAPPLGLLLYGRRAS